MLTVPTRVSLLWFAILSSCQGLNTPKPVKRVAIVGAGISGLAVAHALSNNSNRTIGGGTDQFDTIDIFDSRQSLDTSAGAGIQLNGGLSVLGKINPALQEKVYAAGLPQTRVQSRCKPWFGQKKFDSLLELDLKSVVSSAGSETTDALLSKDRSRLWWTSIMRGTLQQVLFDELPETLSVQFDKRMTKILPSETKDDGASLQFSDGSIDGPYDLVVGAEGINSYAKSYIDFDLGKRKRKEAEYSKSALYSGLRIRYAVADGDAREPPEESATLSQYFGSGAYALHGVYGAGEGKPNTRCAFIIYLDNNYLGPFKKKDKPATDSSIQKGENADWSQDNRKTVELARNDMLEQLRVCGIPHGLDDDLGSTIMQSDRFFELGSYFHSPFSKWSKEITDSSSHIVLCGDAAHALPPFLGQGSNQAIQDAYCLVNKVFDYNDKLSAGDDSDVSMQLLFDDYEKTRWPAVFGIFWKAGFLGYLETGGPEGLYSKFRDVFFKTMGIVGVAKKVLLSAAVPKV